MSGTMTAPAEGQARQHNDMVEQGPV